MGSFGAATRPIPSCWHDRSGTDVREQFGLPVLETLVERLAGQRRLLLLDNAEHLLPELSADIARLRDASGLTIVVTSRERLQVAGEHAWAVPAFANEDAIELFVSRAREIDRNFAHSSVVDELCRRLENSPLALELAAARTSLFTPEQLLERLSERLDLFKDLATLTRVTRPCVRRSTGPTTCWPQKSNNSCGDSRFSRAAALTVLPAPCATPTQTRYKH